MELKVQEPSSLEDIHTQVSGEFSDQSLQCFLIDFSLPLLFSSLQGVYAGCSRVRVHQLGLSMLFPTKGTCKVKIVWTSPRSN